MASMTKKEQAYIAYLLKEYMDKADKAYERMCECNDDDDYERMKRCKRTYDLNIARIDGMCDVIRTLGYKYNWNADDEIYFYKEK